MHDIDRTQMESFEYEFEGPGAGVFSEAEITGLATELMEVNSEAELEFFLGNLIKRAGSAIGKFVKSPTGQALGGILKGAAKQALPVVGGAIGGYVGGSKGSQIGSDLASKAGSLLGLEFESEMENEFETAKSFVRMAGDAVKSATSAPAATNPVAAAKAAVAQAIRVHLPAAAAAAAGAAGPAGGRQGRWIRRGSKIVLLGV